MRKIFFVTVCLFLMPLSVLKAEMITGSITMTDKVPTELFGEWKVISVCTKSTNKEYFGTTSLDIWVLSRNGEVISLKNPLSGARADITVNDVKGQTVKFEKKSFFPNEESTETPILTLQGDKFSGTDTILIKTFQNGNLIKEDYIEYKVKGTKISGLSIPDIFGK